MLFKNVNINAVRKGLNFARPLDDMHTRHKKQAMEAVRVIQEYNSQKLTQRLRKIADEYSVEILGSKKYSPWLYVYALVKGEFKEGWIPDNFYGALVVPRINKKLRAIGDFKSFSNVVLRTDALPDIAYYIDGILYSRELSAISIHELREQISTPCREVFVKKDGSMRGTGMTKLTDEELNEENFQRIGNCVIQSSIKQHEFFEEIISGSVATVRITTVKDKSGKIELRAAYLRLGRKNTSWVQADNSVRVAIVNKSGDLDSFGYTSDWRRWLSHPDTDFSFENSRIPKFKDAIEVCTELHNKVPHFTIIGWDITVGDDETIKIIEWNTGHSDIKFSEARTGPCFLGLDWEKYRKD